MKNRLLKLFIFIIFLILLFPNTVNAKYGDLNYRITNVVINSEKKTITFKGWAYIHRTNNYVKSSAFGDEHGGQKVIMQAYDSSGKVIATEIFNSVDEKDKDFKNKYGFTNENDYNFYCDLYLASVGNTCSYEKYINRNLNKCENQGLIGAGSQCLYEDISFSITFEVSNWSNDVVSFKIGASNNDFKDKLKRYGNLVNYQIINGESYTKLESVLIPKDAYNGKFDRDFIKIQESSFTDQVEFIASYGTLFPWNGSEFKWDSNSFGAFNSGQSLVGCNSNIYQLNYQNSGSFSTKNEVYYDGIHGVRLGKYFLSTSKRIFSNYEYNGVNGGGFFYCPGNETVVMAYGSHVKIFGNNSFKIETKLDKKTCGVVDQNGNDLACNDTVTLNSTCDELTIETDEGYVDVKIEQKGTISSVLTPDNIYAGGGFNFGVMYTNRIKWNYVNNKPSESVHNSVVKIMNDKIKSYNNYVEGIDVSELKIGNEFFKLMKQCTTSSEKKDYYDRDLVVSCMFTFPMSSIEKDGSVNYNYDVNGININNKYYTFIDYNGKYDITANVIGMNRITDKSSRDDSETGVSWTGNWSKTFKGCQINTYALLYDDDNNGNSEIGRYKFIYRPIDLLNPFPNRNAGINWFDWYNDSKNQDRLKDTYSNLEYVVKLDNNAITDIKKYNDNSNYLNFDGIDADTGKSSFITEKNYIDRVGDN